MGLNKQLRTLLTATDAVLALEGCFQDVINVRSENVRFRKILKVVHFAVIMLVRTLRNIFYLIQVLRPDSRRFDVQIKHKNSKYTDKPMQPNALVKYWILVPV